MSETNLNRWEAITLTFVKKFGKSKKSFKCSSIRYLAYLRLIQKQINQKFLNDNIFELDNDVIELEWKKNSNQEINKNIVNRL
jgi:hypothetical protein